MNKHHGIGLISVLLALLLVLSSACGEDSDVSEEASAAYSAHVFSWFASEPVTYDGTATSPRTFTTKFTPNEDLSLFAVRFTYGDSLVLYDSGGTLIWSAAVNVAAPSTTWLQHDLSSSVPLTGGADYYLGIYASGDWQVLLGGASWPTFNFTHGTVDTSLSWFGVGNVFPTISSSDYFSYVNPVYIH